MEHDAPPQPPRRARFQVHLSTAIVLMFVALDCETANRAKNYSVRPLLGPATHTYVATFSG
jgi:hypothetical protein